MRCGAHALRPCACGVPGPGAVRHPARPAAAQRLGNPLPRPCHPSPPTQSKTFICCSINENAQGLWVAWTVAGAGGAAEGRRGARQRRCPGHGARRQPALIPQPPLPVQAASHLCLPVCALHA